MISYYIFSTAGLESSFLIEIVGENNQIAPWATGLADQISISLIEIDDIKDNQHAYAQIKDNLSKSLKGVCVCVFVVNGVGMLTRGLEENIIMSHIMSYFVIRWYLYCDLSITHRFHL